MKKRLSLLLVILACTALLVGCCKHETWNDASCETPKTCAECGETEGAPAGHSWMAATCETAKTCENCGKIEGEALGHSWIEATCTDAKTCQTCGIVEGDALGHTWVAATTEAPKTCTTCNVTEGDRIITDPRFTSASAAPLVGKWSCEIPVSGDMMDLPNFPGEIQCRIFFEFTPDAKMLVSYEIADEETFNANMLSYLIDVMYQELAAEGIGKDAANQAMQAAYGMTVEEYCAAALEELDIQAIFDALNFTMVYYVENDLLYVSYSWNAEMSPTSFAIDGDQLTLEDALVDGAQSTVLTRVTE